MLKKKRLLADPYKTDITLLIGSTDEINKYFAKRRPSFGPLRPSASANHRVWESDDPTQPLIHYVSIIRRPGRTRDQLLACLGHELIHCVFSVFDERRVGYDSEHDEAFAYYHEWLFRLCAREIR